MPVISAMGNLPIVKDLVVDMEPFWAKFRGVGPVAPARLRASPPDGKEYLVTQERMNVDPQGVALHQLRLLRLGVQRDGVRPRVPRPAGAREGRCASSATRATRPGVERLEEYNGEHGIWDCTRCYFCNERCPKGVDPRDAIAKLGAESMKHGIDRDMGAKHAKWFVISAKTTGWLRETELVPKTQGIVSAIKQTKFAIEPGAARQGAAAVPAARRAGREGGARALRHRQARRAADGAVGIVQGERALAAARRTARGEHGAHDPYGEGSFPRPYLAGEDEAPGRRGGADEGQGSLTQADVDAGRGADEEARESRRHEGAA